MRCAMHTGANAMTGAELTGGQFRISSPPSSTPFGLIKFRSEFLELPHARPAGVALSASDVIVATTRQQHTCTGTRACARACIRVMRDRTDVKIHVLTCTFPRSYRELSSDIIPI